MALSRVVALLFVSVVFLSAPSFSLGNDPKQALPGEDKKIVGAWEIVRTKEPGKPYRSGYQGRPFSRKGANAYTMIIEYRKDGTFRRIARFGSKEVVHEGVWSLNGHELRLKPKKKRDEEVLYIRFDEPDRFTSIEVYEETSDPGIFAQFRKIP